MIAPAFHHCTPPTTIAAGPPEAPVSVEAQRSDLQHAVRVCEDIVLAQAVDS